jgi:hypothetical protein
VVKGSYRPILLKKSVLTRLARAKPQKYRIDALLGEIWGSLVSALAQNST